MASFLTTGAVGLYGGYGVLGATVGVVLGTGFWPKAVPAKADGAYDYLACCLCS